MVGGQQLLLCAVALYFTLAFTSRAQGTQLIEFGCGHEGQQACEDGECLAQFLPENVQGDSTGAGWQPASDNFVTAPAGYRQNEGICTRCGNLYEPPCKSEDGSSLCWQSLYSSEQLVPGEDGFCLPREEQTGCGTHGKPVCPEGLLASLGALTLIIAPHDDQPYTLAPTLYELQGCLYSDHNPQLRFVPAPPAWLPDGHKCASVCIHCGHVGEPPCPSQPSCHRRRDPSNVQHFLDGPVQDAGAVCEPLNCGAQVNIGPMAPCAPSTWPAAFEGVDADKDGCAEPYERSSDGAFCYDPRPISSASHVTQAEPGNGTGTLQAAESYCAAPGERVMTPQLVQLWEAAGKEFVGEAGVCVACGAAEELPCNGAHYGGCSVNEGSILNQASGLCKSTGCGAPTAVSGTENPWNASACGRDMPEYAPADDPINPANNCLHLHNLVPGVDGGAATCEPCGFPGAVCEQECLYGLEWTPIGALELNVGTYRLRDDLRDSELCKGIEQLELYPDGCTSPFDPSSLSAAVDGPAPLAAAAQAFESIDVPFTTVCPSGGVPNRKYRQCGGGEWTGPTCCFGFSVCVEKKPRFHMCDQVALPEGIVPWYSACEEDAEVDVCELGSSCQPHDTLGSWCQVDHLSTDSSARGSGRWKGAAIGILCVAVPLAILALALLAVRYMGWRRRRKCGEHERSGVSPFKRSRFNGYGKLSPLLTRGTESTPPVPAYLGVTTSAMSYVEDVMGGALDPTASRDFPSQMANDARPSDMCGSLMSELRPGDITSELIASDSVMRTAVSGGESELAETRSAVPPLSAIQERLPRVKVPQTRCFDSVSEEENESLPMFGNCSMESRFSEDPPVFGTRPVLFTAHQPAVVGLPDARLAPKPPLEHPNAPDNNSDLSQML